MANHFYPDGRQPHHPRRFHRAPPPLPSFPPNRNDKLIFTFQACGCNYHSPTSAQRPFDPTRLIRAGFESHTTPPLYHHRGILRIPTLTLSPPPLHLTFSGHCRVHEFAQFIAVHKHITDEGRARLSSVPPLADKQEEDEHRQRIMDDVRRRLDGMGEKLCARWEGVIVDLCGVPVLRGATVGRFGKLEGFTAEERRMHERSLWEICYGE